MALLICILLNLPKENNRSESFLFSKNTRIFVPSKHCEKNVVLRYTNHCVDSDARQGIIYDIVVEI